MKATPLAGAPMAVQGHTGFGKLSTLVYNTNDDDDGDNGDEYIQVIEQVIKH